MWRDNTKNISISIGDVLEHIDKNTLLQVFTVEEIKEYLNDLTLKNGLDKHNDKKMLEKVLDESFDIEVDIDTDDLDISEYDDYEIINEYNYRKLFRQNHIYDDNINIKEFLAERYDINVSAYNDKEIIDFILKKL